MPKTVANAEGDSLDIKQLTPKQRRRRIGLVVGGAGAGFLLAATVIQTGTHAEKNALNNTLDDKQACLAHIEKFGTNFTTSDLGDDVLKSCGVVFPKDASQGASRVRSLTVELPSVSAMQKSIHDTEVDIAEVNAHDAESIFILSALTFVGWVAGAATDGALIRRDEEVRHHG